MNSLSICIFVVLACCASSVGNKLSKDWPILQGSFFQTDLPYVWGPEGFKLEFKYMKSLKMSHAIWQWTANSKNHSAWYPSKLKNYKYMYSYDAMAVSLTEAIKNNMTIWLGLNDNADWWVMYARNATWLKEQFKIGKAIVEDLWNQYGGKFGPAIAGFYLTFEMDNVNFLKEEYQVRMGEVYNDITTYIHEKTKKPVMVAPFYNENYPGSKQNASEYAKMWKKILKMAPLDIMALQDGMGAEHCTVCEHFFKQIKSESLAIVRHSKALVQRNESHNQ